MNNDILEKGKSMPIGTIHNGFKKIAEGKWRKVSEKGKTKEEHEKISEDAYKSPSSMGTEIGYEHSQHAKKLDSKEYSDQEVLGKEEYKRGDKIKIQESGDWYEGEYVGKDGENHHKVKIKNSIGVYSPRTVHSSAIKRSDREVEKALTTLEIGYLNGEVDQDTIEKARAAALGTRVTHADGVTREKTANGWRPVKKESVKKLTEGVDPLVGITNVKGAINIKDISTHNVNGTKKESNLEIERQSIKQDTSLSYEERSKKLKDLEDKDLLSKEKEMGGMNSISMNSINSQLDGYQKKNEEKKKQLDLNQTKLREYGEKVKSIIPSFENIIQKEGYEVSQMFMHKTGTSDNWEEGDYVKVAVRLKAISGKVKFIQDRGYMSSGAGKNQKQLDAKAESLENKVKEATGLTSVQVNPFSFEIKREGESKTVLLDFWIK